MNRAAFTAATTATTFFFVVAVLAHFIFQTQNKIYTHNFIFVTKSEKDKKKIRTKNGGEDADECCKWVFA